MALMNHSTFTGTTRDIVLNFNNPLVAAKEKYLNVFPDFKVFYKYNIFIYNECAKKEPLLKWDILICQEVKYF